MQPQWDEDGNMKSATRGSALGADNRVWLASIIEILRSLKGQEHGDIKIVVSTKEEAGVGIKTIDPAFVADVKEAIFGDSQATFLETNFNYEDGELRHHAEYFTTDSERVQDLQQVFKEKGLQDAPLFDGHTSGGDGKADSYGDFYHILKHNPNINVVNFYDGGRHAHMPKESNNLFENIDMIDIAMNYLKLVSRKAAMADTRSELRLDNDAALKMLLKAVTGNREEPASVDKLERLVQLLLTSGKFPELAGKIAPVLNSLLERIKGGAPEDAAIAKLTPDEAREILNIFALLLAEPNIALSEQIGASDVSLGFDKAMGHHEMAYVDHEGEGYQIKLNLDRLREPGKVQDEKVANLRWALSHEATHIWLKKILGDKAFDGVFYDKDGQFRKGIYKAVQEVLAYSQSYEDMSTDPKFAGKYNFALLRIKALVELGTGGLSPKYILGIMKNPGENSENLIEIVLAVQAAAEGPLGKIALGILVGQPADETIMNPNGDKAVITGEDAKNPEVIAVAQIYGNLVKLAKDKETLAAIMKAMAANKDSQGAVIAVKPGDPLAGMVAEHAKGKNSKSIGIALDLKDLKDKNLRELHLTPSDVVRLLVALAGIGEEQLRKYLRTQDLGSSGSTADGLYSLQSLTEIFGKELVALQSVSHSA